MTETGIADEALLIRLGVQKDRGSLTPLEPGVMNSIQQVREAMVRVANGEIGNAEGERDNHGVAVLRYKKATGSPKGSAWCADFASYISKESGGNVFTPSPAALAIKQEFANHAAFESNAKSYRPQKGDLVFFRRGNQPWQGHVGIVIDISEDGVLRTIEGNKKPEELRGKVEGIDYAWSVSQKDAVREVSYTPEQLNKEGFIGYGNLEAMLHRAPQTSSTLYALGPKSKNKQRT